MPSERVGEEGLTDFEVLEAFRRGEPVSRGEKDEVREDGEKKGGLGRVVAQKLGEIATVASRGRKPDPVEGVVLDDDAFKMIVADERATLDEEHAVTEAMAAAQKELLAAAEGERMQSQRSLAGKVSREMGERRFNETVLQAIGRAQGEHPEAYREFLREEALKAEVRPGDLLGAAREIVKAGYTPEQRDNMRFYVVIPKEEYETALDTGELAERDEWILAKDLVDGEGRLIKSGRPTIKQGEVALILGDEVIDEPSFDALMPEPTVEEIEFGKHVLGAVVAEADGDEFLDALVGGRAVGIGFGKEAVAERLDGKKRWKTSFWRERQREIAQSLKEHEKHERELYKQVFEEVDGQALHERMKKKAEAIRPEDYNAIFELFKKCKSPEQYQEAEGMVMRFFMKKFGVKGPIKLVYTAGEEMAQDGVGLYSEADLVYADKQARESASQNVSLLRMNKDLWEPGNTTRSVELLAHEVWHAWQYELDERSDAGEELNDEEEELAELYRYNNRQYVRPETNYFAYVSQLVEAEAFCMGLLCKGQYTMRFQERHGDGMKKTKRRLKVSIGGKKREQDGQKDS